MSAHYLVLVFSAVLMAACGGVVSAQNYPNKVIRVVSNNPGSLGDTVARILVQRLTGSVGQPVIVENLPSALIAAGTVARAAPDGYTLLFVGDSFLGLAFMPEPQFDPLKDFAPLTLVALSPSILAVHPSLPVKSVKELIALAKSRPGALNYGTGANGSTGHTAMELFKIMAGVDIVRVAYRGAAGAVSGTLSGEVQLLIQTVPLALPHIKSGKLRGLAATSAQPSMLAPGLPAVAETLPGYEAQSMFAIVAPAKTPGGIVNQLNQEIARLVRSPDIGERLLGLGAQPVGSTPEELSVVMKSATSRLANLIKQAGLKIE